MRSQALPSYANNAFVKVQLFSILVPGQLPVQTTLKPMNADKIQTIINLETMGNADSTASH